MGVDINTRRLAVRTPAEYVEETVQVLKSTWNPHKYTFIISDAEIITGRLGYIAETSPWLRFMMSFMHTSIARALRLMQRDLIAGNTTCSRDFRAMLKAAKQQLRSTRQGATIAAPGTGARGKPAQHDAALRHSNFAASKAAKQVHHSRTPFTITKAMRRETALIFRALSSNWIDMWRPIGHLIKQSPSGVGYSDSCLHAAGGYSLDLGFWWYLEWPKNIQQQTLKFIYNDKDGKLVSINALEYASLIINYVAASHVLTHVYPTKGDPHPVVLLYADNRTAESWLIKASKSSHAGRALGYIQAALMVNNPVGINVDHVTSKDNEIADRISRVKSELALLTEMQKKYKDHPSLISCQRFHPCAELKSLIWETLLARKFVDPLEASRRILATPGAITT